MKTHLQALVQALVALMLAGGSNHALALNEISSIAAGATHTCAVTIAGGGKCWGDNSSGQLGDGTSTQRLTPVSVSGLTNGVAAISAGAVHSCALTETGGVKCWGGNSSGQLGDGTTTQRLTPVNVSGLTSGVAAISAGSYYTCALTNTGGVKCWGDNGFAQLGDGTTTQRLTPVNVSGLTSGAAAVSAGHHTTCALSTTGGAKCWGWNVFGEVGDGTTTLRSTPVNVSGLTSGVAAIGAGFNDTCARTTTGGIKCWGLNDSGQHGDGTTTQHLTPVDVSGLTSGVTEVSPPQYLHVCALTAAGGVKCWGDNNSGRLGDGTTVQRLTPVDVSGLTSGVMTISLGFTYSCALTTTGAVQCWGGNTFGQLGDGTTTRRLTPTDVWGQYRLGGTVLFSGSALAGVSLEGGALGSRTTDQNGSYLFDGISENTAYTLTPAKTGYTFTPDSVSSIVVADTTEDFEAAIATYSISGTVLTGSTPLSGVAIDGAALGTRATNLDGEYFFDGVPHGTSYVLTPSKTDYEFTPASQAGNLTGNMTVDFSADLLPTPTPQPTATPTPSPTPTAVPTASATPVDKDTLLPLVRALKAKIKKAAGNSKVVVQFAYMVSDDSGVTRENVQVFRGRKAIKTINTDFAQVPSNGKRSMQFRLRQKNAKYRFCVAAIDQAENLSAESCTKLRVNIAGH